MQTSKVRWGIKADFGYPMPYQLESREYRADLAGGCLLYRGIYPLALAHYFTNDAMNNLIVKANLPLMVLKMT